MLAVRTGGAGRRGRILLSLIEGQNERTATNGREVLSVNRQWGRDSRGRRHVCATYKEGNKEMGKKELGESG